MGIFLYDIMNTHKINVAQLNELVDDLNADASLDSQIKSSQVSVLQAIASRKRSTLGNYCEKCAGTGVITVNSAPKITKTEYCDICDGNGRHNKTVQKITTYKVV